MDPISIAFLVIGAVIVAAEAFRYIKHKFFHHKEENYGETVTFKAGELNMDSSDLIKLAKHGHNEDYNPENLESHNMFGKDIKITFKTYGASKERTSYSHSERGGSKVAEELSHAVSSLASPWSGAANIVGNVLEVGADHLQNSFAKHAAKTLDARNRSISDPPMLKISDHHASIHEDGCASVGASPVLPRKLISVPTVNVVDITSDSGAFSDDEISPTDYGGNSQVSDSWV